MYTQNENQQAIESRQMIRDALLALMQDIPFQEISISQICRQAQVVRQTYYRHFDSKNDILEFHMDHLFAQYFQSHFTGTDTLTQLCDFYEYMVVNKSFLLTLSRNHLFFMVERTINANIGKFLDISRIADMDDPRMERYLTGFIAASVSSLLSLWVAHGFEESTDWMSRLTARILSGLRLNAPPV